MSVLDFCVVSVVVHCQFINIFVVGPDFIAESSSYF